MVLVDNFIPQIFQVWFSYLLDAEKLVGLDNEAQNLVNCLQVLEILTPALHVDLLAKVRSAECCYRKVNLRPFAPNPVTLTGTYMTISTCFEVVDS